MIHFLPLKQRENNLKNSDYKKCETITNDLFKEFSTRSNDFQKISNDLSLVSPPFAFHVESAPASIQLVLINLQSNLQLKNLHLHLRSCIFVNETYEEQKQIPNNT